MAKKSNKYAGLPPEEELEGLNAYFGLGRAINLSDDITRLAVLCSVIAGVAAAGWELMRHAAASDAAIAGLAICMEFFFSFELAQELDPDRQYAGLIGGVLTLISSALLGKGNILVMLWLLFITRMLARSSGTRHRIGDNFIILGCAAWMGWEGYWLYPIATGAVYALESQMKDGYFRSLYLAALAFMMVVVCDFHKITPNLSLYYLYLMFFTFIIFLPEIRVAIITKARDDRYHKPLNVRRLQTAQAVCLLLIFSISFMHGDTQAASMLPAFMAAIGCGCCLIVDLVKTMKK